MAFTFPIFSKYRPLLTWQRNLEVRAIIYNEFPNHNSEILEDSRNILIKQAKNRYPNVAWIDMKVNATSLELNREIESALLKSRNKQTQKSF